jgi:two-component system cell cycle sensor histidine kinase/response regulator CckA
MVADVEGARRWANWAFERRHPGWIGRLSNAALILAGVGVIVGALYASEVISGTKAQAITSMVIALAVISAFAAFAARAMHAALAGRVDILSQALDASADAQLIIASDGRIAYANTAFYDLFPQFPEAPLDRIAAALADPDSAADFERLRTRAATGTRAISALPLRDARGATAGWFNVSVNPIAGRPGYSFWNFQDITARHEMEAVIHDERNKLVDFLDNAPIGFYSVDGSGRFLFVNQTLAQWLGSTPAEIIASGVRLYDFLATPPTGDTAASDPFGGSGDGEQRGEVALKSRDGRILQAWIGQSIVGSGAELRTRSVVRDLTPEREWETALRLSRERFQRFFANAPVGIALIDRFGRLEEANRALGELFGARPQDLIGEPLIGFVNEDDRREIAVKLAAAADGHTPPGPVEVRLKGPRDKTTVLFLSRLDGIEGGDSGLMLHFIDATEQKNLEVQFAQSQKMQAVGQLAGGVAHDFNNMMMIIMGFSEFLLTTLERDDPRWADADEIRKAAERAMNLTRQLLGFGRQQLVARHVLSLNEVVSGMERMLRPLLGEDIRLVTALSVGLGGVEADERKAAEAADWLEKIERENAGELTPERIAAMEAERSPDGADEVLAEPEPEPEPVTGRRFKRARA